MFYRLKQANELLHIKYQKNGIFEQKGLSNNIVIDPKLWLNININIK